jgi:hypothetical protein
MPAASHQLPRAKRLPRGGLAPRKPEARSRVSNHADLLPNVDGRSIIARRYRDIASQIVADQGGIGRCSEARLQLVRRFAAAACLAEQMEARMARGEQIDIGVHSHLSSTMTRVAQRIGLDRRAKVVPSTLQDYIDGHVSEVEEDAA